ncbi:CD9 antigen-like [Dunckerocampus dactyliophorus]|uniref:CD9 antigen-like n=1 Tax=Dunckerocampus dactyliophorus TaxID=161453 RepID=UPI0024062E93|nr:CD9 antigen-like [Dunckerocampus dactyliophorus]
MDCCGLVCKYIIFIFNFIFAVLGFAFLGLGLWLRFSNSTGGIFALSALNSSTFVIGVTVLIVLGTLMLIVVMFGDYGASSEKKCALQVFSVLLFILALAEVVVGVLAYTQRDEVGARVAEFYNSLYTLFATTGDGGLGLTLMFIHELLHCCGVTGIPLLESVVATCPKPSGFLEKIAMPSCPGIILEFFNNNATMVMALFIGIGALLIIALICSTILKQKLVSSPSPQYIVLTNCSPSLANNPSQHDFVASSSPDQEPIIFTPLTAANIPVVQT